MKKLKLIAPALAVIAFSTAASIAGSVAWFTASRQVTINAGSYAVVKTNSDLTYSMQPGVGTAVNVNTNTVTFSGKLTDGSYNHLTKKIYAPNGAGSAIAQEINLSDSELATKLVRTTLSGDVKVYTAATFKISFTINFGADEKDKGLFLNTTATNSAFTTTGTPSTAKGFRMAIVPDVIPSGSAGVTRVFADLQDDALCSYVSGLGDYDGSEYESPYLIDKDYNAALPDGETARATAIARPDYLGLFKASELNPLVTLSYIVVCWFEGTDGEITTNATDFQEVSTKLVFDAVDLNPAV